MSMFCYQCEEAAKGVGCTIKGVCGKPEDVARYQDLLIYTLKGMAIVRQESAKAGLATKEADYAIMSGLFMTITNANFVKSKFIDKVKASLKLRDKMIADLWKNNKSVTSDHDAVNWNVESDEQLQNKADSMQISILATENEDIRSLRELIIYGVKGMAAYAEHAYNLGSEDEKIYAFIAKALSSTLDDSLSVDELVALTLETGEYGVNVMSLLDAANTGAYGNPEISEVNIGVRNNPAILISGHDLKDLEQLMEQTQGAGVDVYTHEKCSQHIITQHLKNIKILWAIMVTHGGNKKKSLHRLMALFYSQQIVLFLQKLII